MMVVLLTVFEVVQGELFVTLLKPKGQASLAGD